MADEKWLRRMAAAEDAAGCISVGGLAADTGQLSEPTVAERVRAIQRELWGKCRDEEWKALTALLAFAEQAARVLRHHRHTAPCIKAVCVYAALGEACRHRDAAIGTVHDVEQPCSCGVDEARATATRLGLPTGETDGE